MNNTLRDTIPKEFQDFKCIHCHEYAFRHDDDTQRTAGSTGMYHYDVGSSTSQCSQSHNLHQTRRTNNIHPHESNTHDGRRERDLDQKLRQIRGDILIHAGDFSNGGTISEIADVFRWLFTSDNFKYKVVIAGNMNGIGLDDSDRYDVDHRR
ncbi:hypothetical protein I4U23_014262 [Adineta vaga]|nr:hypothetical protein I4U23_014262 [Adineta vaga]